MGLSSLPTPSEGVLSVILVNTVLSIAIFKEIFRSILHIIGIRLDPAFSESGDDIASDTMSMEPLPPYAEDIRYRISSVMFESIGCAHDSECAVCLTKFEPDSEVSRLSCGHFFHKRCFDKWLDYWHSTCPLCRSSLMPEDECW